jgi:hypothetical protein
LFFEFIIGESTPIFLFCFNPSPLWFVMTRKKKKKRKKRRKIVGLKWSAQGSHFFIFYFIFFIFLFLYIDQGSHFFASIFYGLVEHYSLHASVLFIYYLKKSPYINLFRCFCRKLYHFAHQKRKKSFGVQALLRYTCKQFLQQDYINKVMWQQSSQPICKTADQNLFEQESFIRILL